MTGKLKYYLNTWLGLVCAAGRLRTEGILAGGAELTDWRRKPI